MNDSKNTVIVKYAPKPLLMRVQEMIGRFLEDKGIFQRNSLTWALYTTDNSVDFAKVNYWLTRAIFYASEVKNPIDGRFYGKSFLLGAWVGKPIVNSAAAFTIAKLPEVVSDENKDLATDINWMLEQNKSRIFTWVRNGFRDGDNYIRVHKDGHLSLIAPHKVEKIVDVVTGELIGYNITHFVKDTEKNRMIKYVEELRKIAPFRRVVIYRTDTGTGNVQPGSEDFDFQELERPLPIIHFANEAEPDQIYGNSEYQNIYVDMANYHAVMENAVRNNIYNSNAVPVLSGIDNIDKFMESNGVRRSSDGKYELQWNAQKLLLGGKDFKAQIVGGVANANDADKLLNLFFWKMAQGSETPEFVFGTAVSSSKASVQEQMPIAVMKGERKQGQLAEPFRELISTWLWYGDKFRFPDFNRINPEVQFEVKFMPIIDDDMNINIEIVKLLKEENSITDETAMLMLNLSKYVPDFKKEIEAARKELKEKQKLTDPFAADRNGNPNLPDPNQDNPDDVPAE